MHVTYLVIKVYTQPRRTNTVFVSALKSIKPREMNSELHFDLAKFTMNCRVEEATQDLAAITCLCKLKS